ncbi:MAG TPA: HAD family phosphatase [Candidatus Nanoarchaeia archaeon]|nr:HAD family phosphatase [Candidatus Nanoarchaeia archaeon]
MFETVIFDWDGTLADTRATILFSFHKALNGISADVSDEMIERRIGIGAAETFRELLRSQGRTYNKLLIQDLVKKKIATEIELSNQIKLFPGALDLLESLEGKLKLGLASMNNRAVIDRLLETTRTECFFVATVTADEISKPKPDPEVFIKTAQKLQTLPQHCVVIEDSIFGVEAAKAATMTCVAVAQGAYSKNELAKAEPGLVVSSLLEKDVITRFILK